MSNRPARHPVARRQPASGHEAALIASGASGHEAALIASGARPADLAGALELVDAWLRYDTEAATSLLHRAEKQRSGGSLLIATTWLAGELIKAYAPEGDAWKQPFLAGRTAAFLQQKG